MIIDKLDKYELIAVVMPTIIGVIICIWSSWPLIDWLKYADIIEVLPTIIAKDTIGPIVSAVYLIFLSTFVQRFSKYFVETIWFGKNREKFPTTKYLLYCDSFGNEVIANKIKTLLNEQHDIKLLTARQEGKDRIKAVKSIISAVNIIKKEVQMANDDMYNRKNRRYGRCRNLIGSMIISSFISIICCILTWYLNLEMSNPQIAVLISLSALLFNALMYKNIANEYANELFNTYISRYEQHKNNILPR